MFVISTIFQTSTLNPVRLIFNAGKSIAEGVDFVIVSSQPYIRIRIEIRQTTTCHREHICQIRWMDGGLHVYTYSVMKITENTRDQIVLSTHISAKHLLYAIHLEVSGM